MPQKDLILRGKGFDSLIATKTKPVFSFTQRVNRLMVLIGFLKSES